MSIQQAIVAAALGAFLALGAKVGMWLVAVLGWAAS